MIHKSTASHLQVEGISEELHKMEDFSGKRVGQESD